MLHTCLLLLPAAAIFGLFTYIYSAAGLYLERKVMFKMHLSWFQMGIHVKIYCQYILQYLTHFPLTWTKVIPNKLWPNVKISNQRVTDSSVFVHQYEALYATCQWYLCSKSNLLIFVYLSYILMITLTKVKRTSSPYIYLLDTKTHVLLR